MATKREAAVRPAGPSRRTGIVPADRRGNGLGSSLAYAITAVTEQLGTKRVKTRRALSPELLLDLLKQPLWLAGIAANVASFALQVVALRFGCSPCRADPGFRPDIRRPDQRGPEKARGPGHGRGSRRLRGRGGRFPRHRPGVGGAAGYRPGRGDSAACRVRRAASRVPGRGPVEPGRPAARARPGLRRRLRGHGLLDQARDRRARRRTGRPGHPLADPRRRHRRRDRLIMGW